ncbi:MAG: glycerophosphodiester phosphodiesterase [Pseudobutyrivibrio ruminis]|nr:glycerophosphodiester phosphodiesterase [Pseudobutyrivibrio ruminis]
MKCRNFAHRGFSGKYPENTMLAFEKAIEVGCEGIEFDVHFSKDGKLVIVHDETIDRTSNQTGFVKDLTYEELCEADFSYKFQKEYGFQRIPTLEEYLELIKDKDIITNIELKTGIFEYPGIEKAVYDLIKKYDLRDQMIISSFNHYSIMRMKEIDPGIKCGLLTESWLLKAGEYVKNCGVECFHPIGTMLNPATVKEVRDNGIEINTWTVNRPEEVDYMINLGVDGIIGNNPDITRRRLKAAGLR